MLFGMMNSPLIPLFDEIETTARMGADYLELTMDAPEAHHSAINKNSKKIIKALARHDLGLVCHLPTFVYMADLTEPIRRVSVDETLASLQTASDLGASKAVLHPPMISGLGVFMKEVAKTYAFESMTMVVEQAEKMGMTLCIENMPASIGAFSEPSDMAQILARFPNVMFLLDTGHANIRDDTGQRIYDFIRQFGHRLGHLHVSDNKGKRDDHIAVGQGTINFKTVLRHLKQVGYNGTATLEIFSEDRRKWLRSRKQIEAMLR